MYHSEKRIKLKQNKRRTRKKRICKPQCKLKIRAARNSDGDTDGGAFGSCKRGFSWWCSAAKEGS